MEDRRLYAHVGANVPLHYLMLERLIQEDRSEGDFIHSTEMKEIEAERADWEQVVTKHVMERASARLRAVCGQGIVSLNALEEAAGEVGMDKDDVHSALLFLHATGSVLHHGTDTRRSSHALSTVIMQPHFIIDAIKYVIREPVAAASMMRCAHWTCASGGMLTMAMRLIGSSATTRYMARVC